MNALETERIRSLALTFFFDTYNWIFDRTQRPGVAKQLEIRGILLIFLAFFWP
jgi:hypothetical protein